MTYFLLQNSKSSWERELGWLSEMAEGCLLDIEVASPNWGVQISQRKRPFNGFQYDPDRDILYVLTHPLHHSIQHPQEVLVDFKDGILRYLSVQSASGEVETISLFHIPRLAPPNDPT